MGFIIIHQATPELPVQIATYSFNYSFGQRHPNTELLFLLYGEVDILIGDQTYHMSEEDVCLINSNAYHYMYCIENAEALSISFPLQDIPGIHSHDIFFSLNSCQNTHDPRFNYVRYLIAQLVKINASGESHFGTWSLLYALVEHLIDHFQIPAPESTVKGVQKNILSTALNYIEEHYDENLSLADLAARLSVSAPYLSSSFSRHLQITFLQHYNNVRLSHAVPDMLINNCSLDEIARKNGFADIRAFAVAFRRKYGCSPSVYRKQNRFSTVSDSPRPKKSIPFTEDAFQSIAKYLHLFHDREHIMPANPAEYISLNAGSISFSTIGIPLKHHFRKFCCVADAKQFLYADVQEMLRRIQKEIGYEYVKFHGILSDEMMVYTEDEEGHPVYSFVLVDKVLDFIISIHLKPLIQLSFTPQSMASDPEHLIDMRHYNTSPPKSMQAWITLVRKFVEHLLKRYGRKQVESWLFCVWNEPDTGKNAFGWEDRGLFFDFYHQTFLTVKSIDNELRFGTPSLLIESRKGDGWADHFFQYCIQYDCMPDFINIHYYDNNFPLNTAAADSGFRIADLRNQNRSSPLKEDQFAFTQFISELKSFLRKHHMNGIPIYLTEWNLTVSHRDLINDTCFKACYLTKNLLQNYDRLDSYGYWCLTDFHEELPLPNELYHGGLGMFTYNGIPKSHYYAFRFMTHLGNEMIGTGNGYFITKKESEIRIIVYNYEHYSKLFAKGILFDMDSENRYAPFLERKKAKFFLKLTDFPYSHCLIKEFFINQNFGSSYDAWMKMGGSLLEDNNDLSLLREQASPGRTLYQKRSQNGVLSLESELEPLEVRLIQIKPGKNDLLEKTKNL